MERTPDQESHAHLNPPVFMATHPGQFVGLPSALGQAAGGGLLSLALWVPAGLSCEV